MTTHPLRLATRSLLAGSTAVWRRSGAALALLVAGVALGSTGLAVASPSGLPDPSERPYQPHPKTIVDVTGDAVHGFIVRHYDGTVDTPPAREQARAACREKTTEVLRTVCRQEVRIWHRDLADMRRSLNYTQHVNDMKSHRG